VAAGDAADADTDTAASARKLNRPEIE